ncbi:cytochrome c biogenesis protein CcsA [Nonomuraea sp. NPDC049141]|uniref:cytochrome c biogenesis protein CcsA n=1 Tax=unclassified Nonomuraea TaxID=2593643 RepID=UPI0033F4A4B1
MPAEQQLAGVSDLFIVAAVLLYLAAMIGFALELAFGRSSAESPAVRARQPVGVGSSGGPVDASAEPGGGPVAVEPPNWAPKAGWLAMALGWLGWTANLFAIVTRGLAVDRWPWGNMYEFVVAICFAAVTAFLGTQLRHNVRFLGAFVMVTAALGLGFAVKVLYTAAGPVVPALNSYWVAIHVTAAILASGLFVLAGVSGILYLIRGDGASRLPSRADLERVAHRAIVFAFPVWTFAVIAGALWADKAWGRYWGWDPKEVWAFITWVAYAAYLHARVTAGWRGRAATIVQLVAFGCLLFNLVGVNMFISGLHSYSGL